jgi:hypothetical protein
LVIDRREFAHVVELSEAVIADDSAEVEIRLSANEIVDCNWHRAGCGYGWHGFSCFGIVFRPDQVRDEAAEAMVTGGSGGGYCQM